MPQLSVNLNRIALLRNSRNIGIPNLIKAARTVIAAGAQGITVHPRPDQRHIKPADVYELAELLASEFNHSVGFNLAGNPFQPPFLDLVWEVKPTQCTLVPDESNALTSDHGWDLSRHGGRLGLVIQKLQDLGIRVSLLMAPDESQMALVKAIGADRVELCTAPYATAFREGRVDDILERYVQAAQTAQVVGLEVSAGHGLNLQNLAKFCSIPEIQAVSIGHALVAEAVEMGLANTVRAYLEILSGSSP